MRVGPHLCLPTMLLCLLCACACAAQDSARQVALMIAERAGAARVAEPVTSGIPLPQGALYDPQQARLLLGGREVPAQYRVAGRWLPDPSIKWLLVDLQASPQAHGSLTYRLEFGPGVRASARSAAEVRITETDDHFLVSTGAATFRVSKRSFTLFDDVTVEGRPVVGNRSPAAEVRGLRAMVTRPVPGPHNRGRAHLISVGAGEHARQEDYTLTFLDDREFEVVGATTGSQGRGVHGQDFASRDGAISIPASLWLRGAAPRAGDTFTFRTVPRGRSLGSEGVFEAGVRERGPLRSVIQVRGSFGPPSAPGLEYTARYHFHAGSAAVRVLFTIENNHHGGRTASGNADNADIGGVNCVFFEELLLRLPLSAGPAASLTVGGAADADPVRLPLGRRVELYQDSSGGDHWDRYRAEEFRPRPNSYVSFRGYRLLVEEGAVQEGDRALGWLSVGGEGGGVVVAVRDFWQSFPKSLAVAKDGAVEVGLFPGRWAGEFALRSGEHKTHEVLFDFSPSAREDGGRAAALAFSHPLRLEPSPAWFATTRALGDLHPFDPARYPAYEVRNLSAIGVYPEGQDGPSVLSRREEMNFYGWMDYGDFPIDFEEPSGQWGMKYDIDYHLAQHWARSLDPRWWDLFLAASKHHCDIDVHHQPHHPELHFVKGGSWAHSLHSEPGHRNPHRNRNHFTQDLCFGARGAAARHYLTGDWKAYDTVVEQAENALAEYMSPQSEPDPGAHNQMGDRGEAGALNRLLEGYLLTGDERYLTRARWLIRSCAFDGRPASHCPISLWASTFYMMALARYVEMFPEDADARRWLLAHLEALWQASRRPEGMMYTITPQPDGTVTGEGATSMYNIMAADALAVAYRLTSEARYLEVARACFAYGVKHACWKDGPATYTHIHSANGALHGNVFMVADSASRASP